MGRKEKMLSEKEGGTVMREKLGEKECNNFREHQSGKGGGGKGKVGTIGREGWGQWEWEWGEWESG